MINFNQLSPYAHKNCHSNPKPILKLWQDFYKNPNVVCEIKNLITHIDDYHDYQKNGEMIYLKTKMTMSLLNG